MQSYVDLNGLRTFKDKLSENIQAVDTDTYATKDDLIGYVQKDGNKVLSTNDFTTAYKTKLDGVDTDSYVMKVSGKGLSTNDFTTAEKNKLTNIADSAQVNAIESVKVNNVALPISNKTVNIDLANASVKSAASLNSAKSLKVSLASSNAQSFNGSDNATVIGVGGILPVANGGTGNANGTVSGAAKLNTAQNFITNLASTVAGSFNGTASVSAGVTGTLPVANGGTGQTDLNNVTVGGANRDGAGNVITDTYVTKTEFNRKVNAVRYGYRIKQSEADPDLRVEYIYDAAGMRPAHMVFDTDTTAGTASDTSYFDYGDWQSVWFVRDNKPLMLKSDGTVDYYLDPNDYSKKLDGSESDVANTSYGGNAMAQIPLCWVKRYTEGDYLYEIISNVKYDEDYKAYAHTRADGSIADYFYSAMFGASGSASKLRSLSGQSLSQSLTIDQMIRGATANGNGWYIDSWARHEFIRTLLVLIGKSTDTQTVFGNGSLSSLTTGTLKDMGQFFGYNSDNQQVKVFHIEAFWGDQHKRTAGLINNFGRIYVKMTPEGSGYRVSDTTGYINTNISPPVGSGYISQMNCSEYGMIPTAATGSASTYFCDAIFARNNQFSYLIVSGGFDSVDCGAFYFNVNSIPTIAHTFSGCVLSFA